MGEGAGGAGFEEGGIPEEVPTAPIRIRLPDGQQLLGQLHGRVQADSGAWFYEVSVSLWSTVRARDGVDRAEPYDIDFAAPASHVQPVDGTDYTRIPVRRSRAALVRARTRRSPTHTRPPVAAAESEVGNWPPARGDDTDRWCVDTPRAAAGAPPPVPTEVHHAECFVGPRKAELTTAQAVQALAQPGATACTVCGADRLQAR